MQHPSSSKTARRRPGLLVQLEWLLSVSSRNLGIRIAMSRGGHNWKGRGTVEGTRSLDVMKLARAGFLSGWRHASWQWTYNDGTRAWIDIDDGRDEITLRYRFRAYGQQWQSVEQRVPIRWTPCRFGGERPWFICNASANGMYCGRRVAKLYGGGRLFACRHCYRLCYNVQRIGPMDQAHHHLARLHRKLSADYDGPEGPPPPKPKWMRWRTYSRLVQKIEEGEERLDIVFTIGAQRLLAQIERLDQGRRRRRR